MTRYALTSPLYSEDFFGADLRLKDAEIDRIIKAFRLDA